MKVRFIVVIDDATTEQQNSVTNYFKDTQAVGYWHWYSDVWLVTDPNQQFTPESLRLALDGILPDSYKMVLKIQSGYDWSAFGDTESFKWMHETWPD